MQLFAKLFVTLIGRSDEHCQSLMTAIVLTANSKIFILFHGFGKNYGQLPLHQGNLCNQLMGP